MSDPIPAARVPIIYGPTAGGKSSAAVGLAHLLRERSGISCEILTADAFQIYRGMDIGTAKPTPEDRAGIPHHLIDLVNPHDPTPFTVEDWLGHARRAIDDVRARGALPIVVGGTSLYVQSLLFGLFQGPPANAQVRAELAAWTPAQLRTELERVDPAAAARIHPNDLRRSVRAIEVLRLTGRTISSLQTQWENGAVGAAAQADGAAPHARFGLVVLSWPVELLNRRINARVRQMMEQGLLEEVRGLTASGAGLSPQAREALGYKQLLAHLQDPTRLPLAEAVEKIKIETRRFAKNQRTWMKRLSMTPGAAVIDASTLESGSGGDFLAERIAGTLKPD